MERDNLVHRARELEAGFHAAVSTLTSHPAVAEVRGGVGLMAAVVLEPDRVAADAGVGAAFWRAAREHGLLTRGLPDGVALAPPLIVQDEHVQLAVDALAAALDAIGGHAASGGC